MSLQKIQTFTFLKSSRFLFQFLSIPKFLEIGVDRDNDPSLEFYDYLNMTRNTSLSSINYTELRRDMFFLCDSIEFPGQTVTGVDFKIPGTQKIKTPSARDYNEITATFLYPEQVPLYEFFHSWISKMSVRNTQNYYYNEIVSRARAIQYTDGGISSARDIENQSPHTSIVFENLYPTSLTSMQSNWSDDGFQKLSVTFFFEYMKIRNHINYQPPDATKLNNLLKRLDDLSNVTKEANSNEAVDRSNTLRER